MYIGKNIDAIAERFERGHRGYMHIAILLRKSSPAHSPFNY